MGSAPGPTPPMSGGRRGIEAALAVDRGAGRGGVGGAQAQGGPLEQPLVPHEMRDVRVALEEAARLGHGVGGDLPLVCRARARGRGRVRTGDPPPPHTLDCKAKRAQLRFRMPESSSVGSSNKKHVQRQLSAAQGEEKGNILFPLMTVSSHWQPR